MLGYYIMNTIYEERPVVGYEGKYVVSITGKIFSLDYRRTGQRREMTARKDEKGYYRVTLTINGKTERLRVHQVVAKAFHENPDGKPEVDHIDGDPSNNHASNLRWVTHKENCNNPITRKRRSECLTGRRRIFTAEHCNNIGKSKTGLGVSIRRVYPIIPKDELPLGLKGPVSRPTFTFILRTPTDDRYAQCKALVDQYRSIVE